MVKKIQISFNEIKSNQFSSECRNNVVFGYHYGIWGRSRKLMFPLSINTFRINIVFGRCMVQLFHKKVTQCTYDNT